MKGKTYIVTGGAGFVGKALSFRLQELGAKVISISRKSYPELETQGRMHVAADLSLSLEPLKALFSGVDAIFHVASDVRLWGRYQEFYQTNVVGTRNLLAAAQKYGVRKFIYTSSPSVVANGKNLSFVDESFPYPKNHLANYPKTKAIAEREVLSNNSLDFYTLALRPHLIWGPGDNHFVPTILERAAKGKLFRVGKGENLVDISYIEDCVDAHICAAKALDENPSARGEAYFISQGEPVNLWDWIDQVLILNGKPALKRSVPGWLAYGVGAILEGVSSLLPVLGEPTLTRFLVSEMTTDHYFNIKKARTELGYNPKYAVKAAMEKTWGRSALTSESGDVAYKSAGHV